MNRRILAAAFAAPALAAAVAVAVPSTAEAQTITGFYCSGAVAVPGTYGTFKSCASFALSSLSGIPVSKPYKCRLVNNSGKSLNWYREAWTGGNGYIFNQTSYGTHVPPGTWDVDCNAALSQWLNRDTNNYVRASVQVSDSTYGTAGANAYSPIT